MWGGSAALVAVFTFLLYVQPIWALGLLCFARPIMALTLETFFYLGPFRMNVLAVYGLVTVGMMIVLMLVKRRIEMPKYIGYQMGFLLLFLAASLVYSVAPSEGIGDLWRIITPCVYFCFTYNFVKEQKDVSAIYKSVALGSIVPVLFGFYQAITGKFLHEVDSGPLIRIDSTFWVATNYANYLLVIIFASAFLLLLQKPRHRFIYLLTLAGGVISLLLTYGRGSILALVFGSGAWLILRRDRWVTIPMAILLGLLVVVSMPSLRSRFIEVTTVKEVGQTGWDSRQTIWKAGFSALKKSPVFGYGFGSATTVLKNVLHRKNVILPHNDYLRILLDVGLIGIMVFAFLIVNLLRNVWHGARKVKNHFTAELCRMNVGLLASFCVAMSGENILTDVTTTSYLFMSLACALRMQALDVESIDADSHPLTTLQPAYLRKYYAYSLRK